MELEGGQVREYEDDWDGTVEVVYVCRRCRGEFTRLDDLEVDHIKPVSKGGSDRPSNLQLLCPICNKKKGVKLRGETRARTRKTRRVTKKTSTAREKTRTVKRKPTTVKRKTATVKRKTSTTKRKSSTVRRRR
jgi:5-methylcytosine-specific restriction endonuclease McrA